MHDKSKFQELKEFANERRGRIAATTTAVAMTAVTMWLLRGQYRNFAAFLEENDMLEKYTEYITSDNFK